MHTSFLFLSELTSFVRAAALKLQLPIFPTADCGGDLLKSLKQWTKHVLHMLEEQIGAAHVLKELQFLHPSITILHD